MSNDLRDQIYNTLKLRETEELVEIWEINDRVAWSELTFDVIQEILQERLDEIPSQDEPIYEYVEEDNYYDDEIPAEYELHHNLEESNIKINFEGSYSVETLRQKAALIEKPSHPKIIWRRIISIFLVVIFIPLSLYIVQTKTFFSRTSLLIYSIALLLAFFILSILYFFHLHPFLTQYIKTKSLRNNSKIYKGSISDQGIRFVSSNKLTNIPWSKIYQAKQTEELIVIFAEYISPIAFPRSFFTSEVDWRQFRNWLNHYLPANDEPSSRGISNIFFRLHCPKCNNQISDADSICPHCGLDLNAPLEEAELRVLAQPYLEKAQKAIENGRNLHDALSNCNKAIEYLPESAEIYNLRGLILDALGKTKESIQAYQEALRLNPDFTEAKEKLIDAEAKYTQ